MPIRKAAKPAAKSAPTGDDYAQPKRSEEDVWGEENPEEHSEQSSSLQAGGAGWGALERGVEEAKSRGGGGGNIFKFTADPRPVLFLSDGPVAVYERHWVDGRKEAKARKTFKCSGEGCPLCAVGNRPSLRADFQVLDLEFTKDDEIIESPRIMSLAATSAEQLMDLNGDERRGPLVGNWYAVYQTGTAPRITHHFEFIKKRDLEDDWQIPLDGAKEFADEYVQKVDYKAFEPDVAELREVASEIKKSV